MSKATDLLNNLPPGQQKKVLELVAKRLALDELQRRQQQASALDKAETAGGTGNGESK